MGSLGWSVERLSIALNDAMEMEEKRLTSNQDDIESTGLLRGYQRRRADDLVEWVDLIQSGPDPNIVVEEPLELTSSSSSDSSAGQYWVVNETIPQFTRMSSRVSFIDSESSESLLPSLSSQDSPSPVRTIKVKSRLAERQKIEPTSEASEPLEVSETLSSTPSSPNPSTITWKISNITPNQSSSRFSSSSSDLIGDWRTDNLKQGSLSLTHSISRDSTSTVGTWAYSTSTESPSSEFSDNVLTDEDADFGIKRPPKKTQQKAHLRVSPYEIAEHVAKVLQSVTNLNSESIYLIREMLKIIADKSSAVHNLDILLVKNKVETSIFWNDESESLRLMNVFLDIFMLTVSMMLDYLPESKALRLFDQVNRDVSNMLQTLSQLGTVTLGEDDEGRMFDALAMLNSGNLILNDAFLSEKPSHAPLPGGQKRMFRSIDLKQMFRSPSMIGLGVRSSKNLGSFYLPPIRKSSSASTTSTKSSSSKSSVGSKKQARSAVLIAKVSNKWLK